ncbi:MAG: hypothetical protein JNL74_21255, partial [Fibrobacteres bacterium]|nr:hypothetical protein [Fibrobacterota bacterium]
NKVFIDSSYFFNDNSRTVDLRMMNNKNYYLDYSTLLDAAKRLDTNATRINNMNVIKSHRKARRIHEGDARATDSVNNYFNKLYVYPSSKK